MAVRHNNGIGNALTELLGDAIRDTRSKLIDEAWFGRPPAKYDSIFLISGYSRTDEHNDLPAEGGPHGMDL